jgi:hypothetical protein
LGGKGEGEGKEGRRKAERKAEKEDEDEEEAIVFRNREGDTMSIDTYAIISPSRGSSLSSPSSCFFSSSSSSSSSSYSSRALGSGYHKLDSSDCEHYWIPAGGWVIGYFMVQRVYWVSK